MYNCSIVQLLNTIYYIRPPDLRIVVIDQLKMKMIVKTLF